MKENDHSSNPMQHPEEQAAGSNGAPKFGRLLAVLVVAVLFIVALTFAAEAYYS